MRSGRADTVNQQAPFGEAKLEIELAEKAQTDQPVDAEAIGQIEHVHAEVGNSESQCPEPGYAQQVSLLLTHRGATVAICSP